MTSFYKQRACILRPVSFGVTGVLALCFDEVDQHRVVLKKSVFPASQDTVWEKLQQLTTLQYIAKPFASFIPLGNAAGFIWEEHKTYQLDFKLLCRIPFGIHTIHVVEFQKAAYEIYTNETNKYVPVWNHKIKLQKLDHDRTEYPDEVELYAGWKTPFVFLWATLFYAHRQKKWFGLL